MKKITLILLGCSFLMSCGKNNEEQMLYDYEQNNVKALNFDLKDLDFKIGNIDKVSDITAKDSLQFLKKELSNFWIKDAEQSLIDTLSFKYIKSVLTENISHQDTLQKLYQEAVLTAIRIDDYSYKYESEGKRDKAIDEMFSNKETLGKVEKIEKRYNELSKNPSSILSTKYKANYSVKNPLLGNAIQTFDKIFYTNIEQTKFIKEEAVK
ncbi:hypothetical protein [Flavobacterium frigidarium]|uniref:hypothetical protein n=1 Tax=Flavobacterium frigidarium TaxID=99286 RepID=UPI00047EED08|nr:hypothetical protein [Flavobacterium frigidarium]